MASSELIELTGCPCDRPPFPPKPLIPAGLASLPRQLVGFPEYRAALLTHLGSHRLLDTDIVPVHQQHPLRDWLAREGDDLGLMLIEMWAYVLDVLAFYEERIANETYLGTAQRDLSLRRLVELIGYRPRPATAASVVLGLLADTGKGLISIPAGTAFRSSGFDDEPPQVFETKTGITIDPALNRWTLAPIRSPEPGTAWYAPAGDLQAEAGDFVLVSWDRSMAAGDELPLYATPSHPLMLVDLDQATLLGYGPSADAYLWLSATTVKMGQATRIDAVETTEALDGENYTELELHSGLTPDAGVALEALTFEKPVLEARVHSASTSDELTSLMLDSIQSDIRENDLVLVTLGREAIAVRVTDVSHLEEIKFGQAPVSEDGVQPFILVTELTVFPVLPTSWVSREERLKVRFNFINAGTLTRPAKDRLGLGDLQPGAGFAGTVEPPEKEGSGQVLLAGANGHGTALDADIEISAEGVGKLRPQNGAVEFNTSLRTPVKVHGNLIAATRGETVANEVLGSGDPATAFQSFKLKKSPLTWFDDASSATGLRSTLEVRVNRILWKEVTSFFGAGSQDEVYIIREDEEGRSLVIFGDGATGARLPGGHANVTASYRYGAGAAKPPAHSITQIARAVKGLRQVVNPVAAGGGSDADQPEDLRTNASTSSLLLGRAVSLADFEALAREFGGVLNAHAVWAWDGRMQRAVVKVWFISDGGDIAQDLRSHLIGMSDPHTPLEVKEAAPVDKPLVVDLVVQDTFNSDDVEAAVIAALTDEETGLLAPGNIPIGAPLFRSRVLARIHGVEGVRSVRALRFDGSEAGPAMEVNEGEYLDFSTQLLIGNTAAGDVLV